MLCGDRKDPVFWSDTSLVGRSPSDDKIRRILHKWWSGECVTSHHTIDVRADLKIYFESRSTVSHIKCPLDNS